MAPSRTGAAGLVLAALLAIAVGLGFAGRIQAGYGVSVETVHFRGAGGAAMRALLFRPAGATAASPRPAIMAVHGYLNSAEMQGNFATEYARRGYVVLAPDQRGHGASAAPAFADGFGGPDALAYLRSLPFVDRDRIGLEGHSMGGWTVLAAAKAFPSGYRSIILEGSSVGAPYAPEGTATFPRNLLVVYGQRDEFGGFMWGSLAPVHTGAVPKAMALFGTDRPIVPGRLYGNIGQGTARLLETPPVIHAWLHQSRAGITPAIAWFGRTLGGGGVALADDDQIWPWREAGDALALLGVPVLLLGLFALFLGRTPAAALSSTAPTAAAPSGRAAGLAALALVPALLYLPVAMLAERAIGVNALLRQTYSNQIALWAVVCGVLALLSIRFGRRAPAPMAGLVRGGAAALGAVLATMAVVWIGERLTHVDPSWWFIAVRPLTAARARDFLVYLPPFLFFAVASLAALDTIRPLEEGTVPQAAAVAIPALAGGFVLFLLANYGMLAATGALLLPAEGLRVIITIAFVPLFAAIALFGLFSKRWTGSVLGGGILAGLFATWFLVAVQPMGA